MEARPFVIDVPPTLTKEQQELVDDLARVLNGNPRERVLRDAAASVGGAS